MSDTGSKEQLKKLFHQEDLNDVMNEERLERLLATENEESDPELEWIDFDHREEYSGCSSPETMNQYVATLDVTRNGVTTGLVRELLSEDAPMERVGEKVGFNSIDATEEVIEESDFGALLVMSDLYIDVLEEMNFPPLHYGEATDIPEEFYTDDFFFSEVGDHTRVGVMAADPAALLYHLRDITRSIEEENIYEAISFEDGLYQVLDYFDE